MWKYLNNIINKKKNKPNRINTFLSQDNREISDPLEIANIFCHFFSNIGSNLAKKIPSTPSRSPQSYLANQNNLSSFSLYPVTDDEVVKITKAFSNGKAAGYDDILMSIIQNTIQTLSSPLSHIINLPLFSGIVPDQLKVSRVIPLFKSSNKSYFSNY